ncbi:hypothetical protein PHLCEN_2v716 [Hermanssonia centrifuga]|uniref:Aldehyde dehydrogenase n=1 Tax=Hermanssonia centrifuga TaxID=98765 RepID=A0A2R6S5L7_9APHY|nr:hypothetical protein PHLCEN_2v716 [Hermanssonia centrifuga]
MGPLVYTPVEDIPKIHEDLRKGFRSGKTKSIAYRKEQLAGLAYMIKDNTERFQDALKADLGRPPIESDLLDISAALSEAKDAYDNIEKWAKPEKARWDFNWFAMKPTIRKEPKGVVMIIAPFNFPMLLMLGHLASAIAAGNAVLMKPSELCQATNQLIADLVPQYLDPDLYRVVNGDVPVTTKVLSHSHVRLAHLFTLFLNLQLLELRWDHTTRDYGITYNTSIRWRESRQNCLRSSSQAPYTSYYRGKSPVIIDPKCDMKLAARRIFWGKIANAGQVCVAPDYVLIPRDAQDHFIQEVQDIYKTFYPTDPATSDSYSRIISEGHTARIKRYIDETKGEIIIGGEVDVGKKYIAPTVVKNVPFDDSLMDEEIFGPVLPIVPVKDLDEAIEVVNSRDHALSLYVFTQDPAFKAKVFDNTQSGSAVANEVVIHVGATGLPFGGIGPSGSGYHTGKYGFDVFTHHRGTLDNPGWVDTLILKGRYPPYTPEKIRNLRKAFNVSMPPRPGTKAGKRWGLWLVFALLGTISAVLMKRKRA